MGQKITYKLTVQNGGDLAGATLEVLRKSKHYIGALTFKVTECVEETENTRVYILEETAK
jgi:hypothetical protein